MANEKKIELPDPTVVQGDGKKEREFISKLFTTELVSSPMARIEVIRDTSGELVKISPVRGEN